jgi:hypothetical protein
MYENLHMEKGIDTEIYRPILIDSPPNLEQQRYHSVGGKEGGEGESCA